MSAICETQVNECKKTMQFSLLSLVFVYLMIAVILWLNLKKREIGFSVYCWTDVQFQNFAWGWPFDCYLHCCFIDDMNERVEQQVFWRYNALIGNIVAGIISVATIPGLARKLRNGVKWKPNLHTGFRAGLFALVLVSCLYLNFVGDSLCTFSLEELRMRNAISQADDKSLGNKVGVDRSVNGNENSILGKPGKRGEKYGFPFVVYADFWSLPEEVQCREWRFLGVLFNFVFAIFASFAIVVPSSYHSHNSTI